MDREWLHGLLTNKDSDRSKQVQLGPSEVGGCKRRAWYRTQGQPVTNTATLQLSSWLGTAIHAAIESRLRRLDPFEERYLLEVAVEHEGLRGHVDCFDKEAREVIDWKTTTKKSLGFFPSDQQAMQVHLYGFLLRQNGYEVDTVTLVAIPRDGTELDIVVHSEPYDETFAAEGLQWLQSVRELTAAPPPGKNENFCRNYCKFYDSSGEVGCVGLPNPVRPARRTA